jgi:ABC-type antimicrobial peptide transport system permease subunit
MQTLAQGDRVRRRSRLEATGAVAACGMLALVLASIGLYAMVSVAVGQHRREIGIRLALGAHARQVVRMFFSSGLRVSLLGLALGLPLSVVGLVVVLRNTEDLPRDSVPAVVALVSLAVVGVASLASWLPARRAAGVDPMVALRSE